MNRTGTFICAALCVGMVSLSGHAIAEEAKDKAGNGIDLGAIASAIFKPAETAKVSTAQKKRSRYSRLINTYARKHGIPSSLAHAVVRVESNFNAKARGSSGEVGLMQIKLGTARMMGYRGSKKDLYDPETNIKYGMKYLGGAHKLSGGNTCGTILRYNAGHAAKRMNPVSSRYCAKVQKITG